MTSAPEVVPPPQSYTLALATIAVEARPSEGRILLRVGEGFRDALYSPENIAERALVTRLVEGAAVLAGAADPAALGRALTSRIPTNPQIGNTAGRERERPKREILVGGGARKKK